MPRSVDLADRERSLPLFAADGGVAAAPFGAGVETRANGEPVQHEKAALEPRPGSWRRTALRGAAHLAIALAIVTLVPVASLTLGWKSFLFDSSNVKSRVSDAEVLRPLRSASDAAMTPARAGAAMHALFPTLADNEFVVRPVQRLRWPTEALGAALFADIRTPQWWGPDASKVITRVAARVSPEEMKFLETMANAPAWPVLDDAARAGHADIVGGRFETPFSRDANATGMPIPRFADVKAVAHASVTRAAYYVARGDHARAEQVLRNAMGVAFLLIDDGPAVIDALTGRVLLGIVADGLSQLYAVTRNEDGAALVSQFRSRAATRATVPRDARTLAEWRAALQREIADETLPRSVRFEQLRALQFSKCASPGELLLGRSPAVEAANVAARRTLAVTPGELAYVDLLSQTLSTMRTGHVSPPAIAAAAAQVVSAVTGREEFATCTRILAGLR